MIYAINSGGMEEAFFGGEEEKCDIGMSNFILVSVSLVCIKENFQMGKGCVLVQDLYLITEFQELRNILLLKYYGLTFLVN